MDAAQLVDEFLKFGLALLLGFAIGLERETADEKNPHAGVRDFVLFALLGAVSSFAAELTQMGWLIIAAFAGLLIFLGSGYWSSRNAPDGPDGGITTEVAGILTFFLGVILVRGIIQLPVAIAIAILAVLSQKRAIGAFRARVQRFELDATLKLLVITFIILPVLPRQSLDEFLTLPMGTVENVNAEVRSLTVELRPGQRYPVGEEVPIYGEQGRSLGTFVVGQATPFRVSGSYTGEYIHRLEPGDGVRTGIGNHLVTVMLSAIEPYKVWLIVVLVSFVSFVGYVLVKTIGADAGIGLTGLGGGLASSTVTTLSFARRSREAPRWSRHFAAAVILASSVMFPRLLLQIAVVNRALMESMAPPITVMGVTGLTLALFHLRRPQQKSVESEELVLENPFSLRAALTFAAVFTATLAVTRVAIAYLGSTWLPLVSVVSGLTDADAIAFSLSNAEQAGLISLDWASFNAVLGAIANTFMKLLLAFALGDRALFRHLVPSFLIIAAAGIVTMLFYYDFSAAPP